ncbi:hypothetical protein GTZ99_12975 [Novosphingobium sp. FSY-8]|uniref:Flap endonuclease-1-like 5' DNA nuclease n=1 Tax=Novosphingobium ovatum TaxID=1908523 RepID=A0ABW9XFZ1_9SPHN|nr:hypothetical protein [Novosphingobium ovatum]NBC37461.1 hypothetical protein [Novosphingobium ovatum]
MMTMVEANWPVFGVVLMAALLVAWLIWGRRGAARQRAHAPDMLDEGVGPTRRNQALIDAPSAAAQVSLNEAAVTAAGLADSGPAEIVGGLGAVVAAGASAEVAAEVAAEVTAPPAVEGPAADGDDLTRIKGLGPKLRARLAELGVTRFAQIAAWTEADIATIDAQLGSFAGRATRDQWVAQAGFLASGDTAGYEAKFGKL